MMPTRAAIPQLEGQETLILPLAMPDMADVQTWANQLHEAGQFYEGVVWGWPVSYDPEWREDAAEFQIPDGQGGFHTEIRPFWSPASFTIGQNGFWFYSLLWEDGRDAPPSPFMEPNPADPELVHF